MTPPKPFPSPLSGAPAHPPAWPCGPSPHIPAAHSLACDPQRGTGRGRGQRGQQGHSELCLPPTNALFLDVICAVCFWTALLAPQRPLPVALRHPGLPSVTLAVQGGWRELVSPEVKPSSLRSGALETGGQRQCRVGGGAWEGAPGAGGSGASPVLSTSPWSPGRGAAAGQGFGGGDGEAAGGIGTGRPDQGDVQPSLR